MHFLKPADVAKTQFAHGHGKSANGDTVCKLGMPVRELHLGVGIPPSSRMGLQFANRITVCKLSMPVRKLAYSLRTGHHSSQTASRS